MSAVWDRQVAPLAIWKECFRVLKHGAFAFVMTSPRQDLLADMIITLKEAGFKTGFTSIFWTYAQGMTKGQNIAKRVDEKLGFEPKKVAVNPNWRPTKTKGGMGFDKHVGNGSVGELYITEPVSPQAKALDGAYSGFQPRPAVEVVLCVMKPIKEKSHIEQAMKDGKGVTWLRDCKIPSDTPIVTRGNRKGTGTSLQWKDYKSADDYQGDYHPEGRFPGNLLISDDILQAKTSQGHWPYSYSDGKYVGYGKRYGGEEKYVGSGPRHKIDSFSDYFSLDNWWGEKIKELPVEIQKNHPFWIIPKPNKKERHLGCENIVTYDKKGREIRGNHHISVKPVRLFSYLLMLASRSNDIVLDPFLGSGTSAIACKLLGRRFIGMEISADYVLIARKRVQATFVKKNVRNLFKRREK